MSGVFLLGCSTTLHTTNDKYYGPGLATIGVPYSLPMAQFQVTLKRQLSQCEDKDKKHAIGFVTTAAAEPVYIAGETYLIDYSKLSSAMKTSSFEIENHEETGTLKSINAKSADKSKEIVAGVVGISLKVGSLIAGVPPISTSPPAVNEALGETVPVTVLSCSESARNHLIIAQGQKETLKDKSDALKKATDALAKKMAELVPIITADALTSTQKSDVEKLLKTQTKAMLAESEAQKALEETLKNVTISHSFNWPTAPHVLQSMDPRETMENRTKFEVSDKELKEWGKLLTTTNVPSALKSDKGICNYDDTTKMPGVLSCIKEKLRSSAFLSPNIVISKTEQPSEAKLLQDNNSGLLYRSPGLGTLKICKGQSVETCKSTNAKIVYQSKAPISIPQLGKLRILPFANGPFQDNALSVEFLKNGNLKSLSYKENSSVGQGAVDLGNDSLSQISTYIATLDAAKEAAKLKEKADAKELEEERKAALAEAQASIVAERAEQIAQLTYEIDLLKLNQSRNLLVNPASPSELSLLTTQTEIEELQSRQLQAILTQLQTRNTIADITP